MNSKSALRAWVVGSLGVLAVGPLAPRSTAAAQAGAVFRLEDARSLALKRRPELAGPEARIAAAAAELDAARASRGPRIVAAVDTVAAPGARLEEVQIRGRENDDEGFLVSGSPPIEAGLDAFEPVVRYGGTVGLDLSVFDFGRTAARRRAAEAEQRARAAELARTRAGLIAAVDAAYLNWLASDEQLRLEDAALARSRSRLERMRARMEAGAASRSALIPLRYGEVSAELRRAHAAHAEARSRIGLAAALGAPLPKNARPDRSLLEGPTDPRAEDARGAEGRVLEARVEAAQAQATLSERAQRPELGLRVEAGLRGQEGRLFPLYSGGLTLTFPIWDGGASSALARAARSEAEALAAQAEVDQRDRRTSADQRELDLASARQQVQIAERLAEVALEARADVESRLDEMAATSEDLNQADERVAQARATLLEAKVERARVMLSPSPS